MSEQITPKKNMSKLTKILIGLGLLFVLLFVGCSALVVGAASTSVPTAVETEEPIVRDLKELEKDLKSEQASDAVKNVKIDSCKVSSGYATVEYTIDNPTSGNSDYSLEFDVVDATGIKVGTAIGFESNVSPARVSKGEGIGSVSSSTKEPVKCSIAEVTRMASS